MSSARRAGVRRVGVFGVSLYVVMLVVSPVLHHDLECHAKSPTHCTACVANPVAPGAEPEFTVSVGFVPVGEVATTREAPPSRADSSPAAGRSPPAESL